MTRRERHAPVSLIRKEEQDPVRRGHQLVEGADDGSERLTAPSYYQVYACGPFLVKQWDGTSYQPVPVGAWSGSHSPRLLLKVLLCSPGRQASRGRLLDLLWPDSDPEEASSSLNDAAYRLRAVLRPTKGAESLLLTAKDTSSYALVGQADLWVDADAALTLLEQAEQQGENALSLLEEAAGYLSRGEFLAEEELLFFYGRRATVARARRGCLLAQAKGYERQGRMRRAEGLLGKLLEENPLDEDALRALMLNLHQQRRTSEGLRLYEETKGLLKREGLTPTKATQATEEQLRSELPSPALGPALPLYLPTRYNGDISHIPPTTMQSLRNNHPLPRNFFPPLAHTSNSELCKDIIDRNFRQNTTYGLLSSNIKTMNFRDEWQYIVNNLVSETKFILRAMVFDIELTRWWNTIAGQIYMMTNMELLKRGVPIRRIFLLGSFDAQLRMNMLMNAYVHHKIGIDVRVCKVTGFQEHIPFKPDMFSVHDNLFVALYYFSFEKPLTNILLEDKYISEFSSFYDELFMDDRLCSDIETILAQSNCGTSFFASTQAQLQLLQRLAKAGSVTNLARNLWH